MKYDRKAIEDFRKFLVHYTGCNLQEGKNGKRYPCGTCTLALLRRMGLNPKKSFYGEHNEEIDRANEVWRAILQIREV